ncbi:MAG: DUF333 domain-containing protein [Candidatus Aenigmarchaeota archaeon]|nr:DUF333 domain-containing protein [Candidatus Aenigmarchaeota archaeon]NIQ17882.1 DUF333 domain-containing protein [Candidatus Aenigmarchaeota archaeon]NIS73302.1 DUF333 domain-containing protein [Candidatus Aenigmarchaeota archaeon]
MKKKFLYLAFLILIIITLGTSGCVRAPEGSVTASELLENPVYDTEVTVYGLVSNLGELFCPCFTLTSGGKSLEVWYDLMTDGETEWPAVSVEGIRNGDWVTVTGQLRSSERTEPSKKFWIKSIVKADKTDEVCKDLCGDGTCQEVVCQAVGCPCSETPETCPQDCKSTTELPNPAAVYCERDKGGVFQAVETPEGTAGYCSLPDGRVCEEWAFFRSNGTECNPPE